jgi:hypothetical protein
MSAPTELYEQDFYAWTQEQAAKLRAGVLADIDVQHLAAEVESMGGSERRELTSRLEELLLHLLKWRYQPGLRGPGWEISISKQRDGLEDLFETSPSLRPKLPEVLSKTYRRARRYAAKETGLPAAMFPEGCPFTVEQILDDYYWPVESPAGDCSKPSAI